MDYAGGGTDGSGDGADADGNPNVFNVNHDDNGRWLNNKWAKPDNKWNPDNQLLFRLRNSVLPRYFSWRVFFFGEVRFFFHPPSILPVSSSLPASCS